MNTLARAPHPFFTDRKVVFALATLCCLFWGSSYPAIKGGYALFEVAREDIPSKLLFAGWRFIRSRDLAEERPAALSDEEKARLERIMRD